MARNEKGQFEKGTSGNPAGKPVGSNSKAKEWQDEFFERDKAKAKEDWEKLSPGQRWQIRAKYWDFQFPKLRSEHVDLSFDQMSDAMAGRIISSILENKLIDENNEVKFRSPDAGQDDSPADNT